MNIFKNRKKSGFTLMEVAIAVMIVGVLTAICIPVIQRQLEKSDEYAYYMAYRSVEKLGGQIVALGDPDDELYNKSSMLRDTKLANDSNFNSITHLKNKIKLTFSTLNTRFTYTEKYLFKTLFPKSFAAEDWEEGDTFNDDDYVVVNLAYRVCKGGETIQKPEPTGADENGNPTYSNYNCNADFPGLFDDGAPIDSLLPEEGCFIGLSDSAKSSKKRELENFIISDKVSEENISIKGYCEKLASYCGGTDSATGNEYKVKPPYEVADEYVADDEDDGDDDTETHTKYVCQFMSKRKSSTGSSSSVQETAVEKVPVTDTCTPAYGYYGMENAAQTDIDGKKYALSCECKLGKSTTQNNDKVCCSILTGTNSYARSNITSGMAEGPIVTNNYSGYCVHCDGDYNSVGNWCCPEHSVFNGTECQCVEGYDMLVNKGTSTEECQHTACAKGSHLDKETDVCVPNPPLLKADSFCNQITKNWNTTSNSCNTFSMVDGSRVYAAVLDAAKSSSGAYLSLKSKSGSFANITPNIILSNGLKLWILGDKAASIPGLSYNPMNITQTQNMCREIFSASNEPLSTKEKCDNRSGYFCKGEAHCYTLDAQSLTKMGDARNCCSATDISDIAYAANADKDNRAFAVSGFTVFVDINGDKGSGTLWEDVFPFFVGANGKVYPGYPLDAPKDADSTSNGLYLAGNSVKNLPVDVYYYDNDDRSDNARKKIVVWSNVSYARGVCYAKILNSHTPYCQNLGLKARGSGNNKNKIIDAINDPTNICNEKNCFINVRNKLRFF